MGAGSTSRPEPAPRERSGSAPAAAGHRPVLAEPALLARTAARLPAGLLTTLLTTGLLAEATLLTTLRTPGLLAEATRRTTGLLAEATLRTTGLLGAGLTALPAALLALLAETALLAAARGEPGGARVVTVVGCGATDGEAAEADHHDRGCRGNPLGDHDTLALGHGRRDHRLLHGRCLIDGDHGNCGLGLGGSGDLLAHG